MRVHRDCVTVTVLLCMHHGHGHVICNRFFINWHRSLVACATLPASNKLLVRASLASSKQHNLVLVVVVCFYNNNNCIIVVWYLLCVLCCALLCLVRLLRDVTVTRAKQHGQLVASRMHAINEFLLCFIAWHVICNKFFMNWHGHVKLSRNFQ